MFSDPRYESELERIFEWDFAKCMKTEMIVTPQSECATMVGTFRLDFLISGAMKVGVELDGEEFHNGFRDECRDAMILGEGHGDVIYRFRGKDIFHNTADMLYFMSLCDPWMFRDGAGLSLKNRSSRRFDEAGKFNPEHDDHSFLLSFFEGEEEKFRFASAIRRSNKVGMRQYWRGLYEDAIATRPPSLDAFIEQRLVRSESVVTLRTV
jgi:hypothetical protein